MQIESYCKYRCAKWGTGALTLGFLILGIYSAVHAAQTEHPCILLSGGASIVYFILSLISIVIHCLTKKKKLEQKKSAQFSIPEEVLVHLSSFLYPHEMVPFGETCKANQITCLQNAKMHTSWALFLGQPKGASLSAVAYVHYFYQQIRGDFSALTLIHDSRGSILWRLLITRGIGKIECLSQYILKHSPGEWDREDTEGRLALQRSFNFSGGVTRHEVGPAYLSLMIAWGANVNQSTHTISMTERLLYTPLSTCIHYRGSAEIVAVLLHHGADVHAPSGDLGLSPLQVALQRGHSSSIKLLLKAGADINQRDALGRTALHYASKPEDLRLLFEQRKKQGIEIDQTDFEGSTPLISLLKGTLERWRGYNRTQCFKIVQERGVIAECVHLLLREGANPDIQDQDGVSPRTLLKNMCTWPQFES